MFLYWLLFLVFALGAVEARRHLAAPAEATGRHFQPPPLSPMLILAAIVPIVLIGFRYEVGGDWYHYSDMYFAMSYLNLGEVLTYTDPGYGLLNWLANILGFEIWFVNFICAVIFTAGLVRFAQHQPNPWLAVLVAVPYLVIAVAMGYTRQGVAIGCALFGLAAIARGSFPRFVFWILVAATFHRTAVVLLPIVGFSYTRNRLQTVLLALVGLGVGYRVLLAPALETYSRGYLAQVYEAEGAGIRLAMNVVPAFLFLALQKRFGLPPAERVMWRNISLLAIACIAAYYAIASSVIVDRLALYLIPVQIFVFARLPNVFSEQGKPSGLTGMMVIAYAALVQFVWLNFANHAEFWLPYQFYPLL